MPLLISSAIVFKLESILPLWLLFILLYHYLLYVMAQLFCIAQIEIIFDPTKRTTRAVEYDVTVQANTTVLSTTNVTALTEYHTLSYFMTYWVY